jgi:hypothetical protein
LGICRWLYKVYKTLQIKNTKLYTFEIIYHIIASVNPRFSLENGVFWRVLARFRMTIWQCKAGVNPCFWGENGDWF